MLRGLLLALAVGAASLTAACQRPTPEQCERICWRFNELSFWETFERDAEGLDPAARDALRAERQKAWEAMKAREKDPGLENCIRDCRRGAKPEDADCVDKATTSAAAQACLK